MFSSSEIDVVKFIRMDDDALLVEIILKSHGNQSATVDLTKELIKKIGYSSLEKLIFALKQMGGQEVH